MRCEWRESTFGEIADIIMGQSPKGENCFDTPCGMPLLNGPTEFGLFYPTPAQWTTDTRKKSQVGDVLFCVRGSTTGRMNWSNIEFAIGRGIAAIRHKNDVDLNRFIRGILDLKLEEILASATGSTFPNVGKDLLNSIKIELPSLIEQKAIADTLSCLDDKIELNNKINENLEQQAQAIFKSWFVDFEPFQDGEFEESELGMIPKGWRVGCLADIAHITSGKRPPSKQNEANSKGTIPIVGASSIMGYTTEILYNEKIIVTGRVGTHGVLQRFNSPCWTSDNTLVMKSNFYEFTFQILSLVDYKNMNRGSTQPLITQTDLKNVSVIIPTQKVLTEYEILVGALMNKYEANNIETKKNEQIRDTLLPKLMSGEIEVTNPPVISG